MFNLAPLSNPGSAPETMHVQVYGILCVTVAAFLQLYYLNSALSLYFPYDFCLFHEMDAVLSYGLRYIPIMITSSVCLILLILYK